MKLILRLYFLSLLWAVSSPTAAFAVRWNTFSVAEGEEIGRRSETVIDHAGRVHVAYLGLDGGSLRYLVRPDATTGFPTESEQVFGIGGGNTVVHFAISVTSDFVIQVALVTSNGNLIVRERAAELGAPWQTSISATGASAAAETGISLISRGYRGARASAVVYNATPNVAGTSPTDSLGVIFREQDPATGDWSTAISLTDGARSGLNPVIVTVPEPDGTTLPLRYVFYYDNLSGRLLTRTNRSLQPAAQFWSSPETVVELQGLPVAPEVAVAPGRLGISYVTIKNGDPQENAVWYTEPDTSGGATTWSRRRLASLADIDSAAGESIAPLSAITLDPAGGAMVVYTVIASDPPDTVFTRSIRAVRLTPGVGWSTAEIERRNPNFPNGLQITNGISLSSGRNGDPGLFFERDTGTRSELVFARPANEAWGVGAPAITSQIAATYGPDITAAAGGGYHLIASARSALALNQPAFPIVATVLPGGRQTAESLPITAADFIDNAITTAPDGSLHAFSLRKNGIFSGELEYFTRRPGANFLLRTASGIGEVDPRYPLSCTTDDAGGIYVAYSAFPGSPVVVYLPPGANDWQFIYFNESVTGIGAQMAVRGDGGIALGLFDPLEDAFGEVAVVTNIDLATGRRASQFSRTSVEVIGTAEDVPENVACVFGHDGFPRLIYGAENSVVVSVRSAGGARFEQLEVATGIAGATVAATAAGGQIHVAAQLVDNGIAHFSFPQSGLIQPQPVFPFANPAIGLASPETVPLAITVGDDGASIIATGLLRTFVTNDPVITDPRDFTVVVARPNDALDQDGDGLNLLQEEAWCSDPLKPGPGNRPRASATRDAATGSVTHSFSTVIPGVPAGLRRIGEPAYGEFEYLIEASADLQSWRVESSSSNILIFGTGIAIPAINGCSRITTGYTYRAFFLEPNPARFSRLSVIRDR